MINDWAEVKSNHYTTLGIEENATEKQIHRAYRLLALRWHPDKNKKRDTTKIFIQIQKSHSILSNTEKRLEYDSWLSQKREEMNRFENENKDRLTLGKKLLVKEKEHFERMEKKRQKEYEQEFNNNARKRRKLYEGDLEGEEEIEKFSDFRKSSVKIKWYRKNKVVYGEELLREIFAVYGIIDHISVEEDKRKALICFSYPTAIKKYLHNIYI